MNHSLYVIGIMAIVTYLVRVLPLTLVRKEIKNVYLRSFLYYVPFVTLAVMIFPAIIDATDSHWSALVGFGVAVSLAYFGVSLIHVALFTVIAVFVVELFLV